MPIFNPTDFPEPTLISVNGVRLEVFEATRLIFRITHQ